jgi:hypothetical protein
MTAPLGHFTDWRPLLPALSKLVFYAWPIMLLDWFKFRSDDAEPITTRWPVAWQAVTYASLFLFFVLFGNYEGASFIYFQF